MGVLGKGVEQCQRVMRGLQIWEMENRELRSALRAEREHVAQLRRKLDLLQALVPVTD